MIKHVAILGSTGSIGKTLIKTIEKDKKKFKIELLTCNKNYDLILKQAYKYNVKNLIIIDKKSYNSAIKKFKNNKLNIYNNYLNFKKIFTKKIDYTMSAISGLDGLNPTLKIIKYSKKIAIANKESIICGWPLISSELKKNKTSLIPVDSEHFSIWFGIQGNKSTNVEKFYLTASGGPFLNINLNKIKKISIKDALKHPNWSMGKKISIDSATLMNKVFEIIEAKNLFDISYEKLDILIHPKSYVHAIIKFKNGISKILLHDTNMNIPIFNTIYSENEKDLKIKQLDFEILNDLKFSKVDTKKFPLTKIIKILPEYPSLFETALVSANDELVNFFLKKKINFLSIQKILLKLVKSKLFLSYRNLKPNNLNDINKVNKYVRLKVSKLCI